MPRWQPSSQQSAAHHAEPPGCQAWYDAPRWRHCFRYRQSDAILCTIWLFMRSAFGFLARRCAPGVRRSSGPVNGSVDGQPTAGLSCGGALHGGQTPLTAQPGRTQIMLEQGRAALQPAGAGQVIQPAPRPSLHRPIPDTTLYQTIWLVAHGMCRSRVTYAVPSSQSGLYVRAKSGPICPSGCVLPSPSSMRGPREPVSRVFCGDTSAGMIVLIVPLTVHDDHILEEEWYG